MVAIYLEDISTSYSKMLFIIIALISVSILAPNMQDSTNKLEIKYHKDKETKAKSQENH